MLHETDPPKWTKVFAGQGSVRIYNNTFYGTDGIALEYGGVNDTVENNMFEYNDWSGANMVKAQGGMRIRNGSQRHFQPCRQQRCRESVEYFVAPRGTFHSGLFRYMKG